MYAKINLKQNYYMSLLAIFTKYFVFLIILIHWLRTHDSYTFLKIYSSGRNIYIYFVTYPFTSLTY